MAREVGVKIVYENDLRAARAEWQALVREMESRPVRINMQAGSPTQPATVGQAATFGAPGGLALSSSSGGFAASRLADIPRFTGGSGLGPIFGPVGMQGGAPPPTSFGQPSMPMGTASPNWSYHFGMMQNQMQAMMPNASINWPVLMHQLGQQIAGGQRRQSGPSRQAPRSFFNRGIEMLGYGAAVTSIFNASDAYQTMGINQSLDGNDLNAQLDATMQGRTSILNSGSFIGDAIRLLESPIGRLSSRWAGSTAEITSTQRGAQIQTQRTAMMGDNARFARNLREQADIALAGSDSMAAGRIRAEAAYRNRAEEIQERKAAMGEIDARQIGNLKTTLSITREDRITAMTGGLFDNPTIENGKVLTREAAGARIDKADAATLENLRTRSAAKLQVEAQAAMARAETLRVMDISAVMRGQATNLARDQAATQSPIYQLNRNAFGELASTFRSESIAIINSSASIEDRRRLLGQNAVRFGAHAAMIARDNREASYDLGMANRAMEQQRSGDYLASGLTRIEGERTAALREVGGTGSRFMDSILGYTGRRQVIEDRARLQRQEARDDEARRLIGVRGSINSSMARLGDRPLDAQLASIDASYEAAIWGKTDPREIGRISMQHLLAKAEARQQFNNQVKLVDIEQRYTAKAQQYILDKGMAAESTTLEAMGIAGQTIARGNQLAMAGMGAQAETQRSIGFQALEVLKRNYQLGFRGTEIDVGMLGNMSQRDTSDPTQVFADIAKQQQDIQNAKFGSDTDVLPPMIQQIIGILQNFPGLLTAMTSAPQ